MNEAQDQLRFALDYLSQHDEPSAGCAQQAPPLSSGVSLGVQQTEALFFGAQQEDAGALSFFSFVMRLFVNTGIALSVSIIIVFTSIKTDTRKNDALS